MNKDIFSKRFLIFVYFFICYVNVFAFDEPFDGIVKAVRNGIDKHVKDKMSFFTEGGYQINNQYIDLNTYNILATMNRYENVMIELRSAFKDLKRTINTIKKVSKENNLNTTQFILQNPKILGDNEHGRSFTDDAILYINIYRDINFTAQQYLSFIKQNFDNYKKDRDEQNIKSIIEFFKDYHTNQTKLNRVAFFFWKKFYFIRPFCEHMLKKYKLLKITDNYLALIYDNIDDITVNKDKFIEDIKGDLSYKHVLLFRSLYRKNKETWNKFFNIIRFFIVSMPYIIIAQINALLAKNVSELYDNIFDDKSINYYTDAFYYRDIFPLPLRFGICKNISNYLNIYVIGYDILSLFSGGLLCALEFICSETLEKKRKILVRYNIETIFKYAVQEIKIFKNIFLCNSIYFFAFDIEISPFFHFTFNLFPLLVDMLYEMCFKVYKSKYQQQLKKKKDEDEEEDNIDKAYQKGYYYDDVRENVYYKQFEDLVNKDKKQFEYDDMIICTNAVEAYSPQIIDFRKDISHTEQNIVDNVDNIIDTTTKKKK